MKIKSGSNSGVTIGQVAREAGIGIETVRFYGREGLLEQPARRLSGYRQFEPDAVIRLHFIKQAQRLGFTLREIKELLALKLDPGATRVEVRQRAVDKVADIDRRIADLKRMKDEFEQLTKTVAVHEDRVNKLEKREEESDKRQWQFVYIFAGAMATLLVTLVVQLVLAWVKK